MVRDLDSLHRSLDFPPPPPGPHRSFSTLLIAVICFLGGGFLLVSYYAVLTKYCSKRRDRTQPIETREDLDEQDRGQALDHPIWLINTVGLDQSVISSISVFRFKKVEGLIEGTDCSVCLSEFEEDECLRLLPKCSHAFHLHCIDAWLRSHTNCPLCRAPIVAAAAVATTPNSVELERGVSDLGARVETQIEVLVGEDGLGRNQSGGSGRVGEERIVDATVVPHKGLEIQAVRRSVSMDSSLIGNSSASGGIGSKELSLNLVSEEEKQLGANQRTLRLVGGCSSFKGLSPQKGLVSMKRSFSSGGKFWFSRYSRSNSSIPHL